MDAAECRQEAQECAESAATLAGTSRNDEAATLAALSTAWSNLALAKDSADALRMSKRDQR